MWLGRFQKSLSKPLNINWPDAPLRILGIYASYDSDTCIIKNFKEKLANIKAIINTWKGRNLTMIGRIQIIKTFLISQLLYVSSALDIPEHIIRELDHIITDFVWKGIRAKVGKLVLKKGIEEGGLKMPDLHTMIETLRLKWINRLFSNTSLIWPQFLSKYLLRSGINLNALLRADYNMKYLNIIPNTHPTFYYKVLEIWSRVGESSEKKSTFLWYDKALLINGKSFFYQDFYEAGITHIQDLFKTDGTVIPFSHWINKGVSKSNMIKWVGLIQMTTKLMKTKEQYNHTGERNDTHYIIIENEKSR